MESKPKSYMALREKVAAASLMLLCLFYIIMLGGGNYEQMNVTRLIVSSPPESFAILTGEFSFSPIAFWVTFRPLTILLFLISIVMYWKNSARNILLLAFTLDLLVTVSTFLYFAPEVGSMISAAKANQGGALRERATLWYHLNYVRLGMFYIVGILLLFALGSFSFRHASQSARESQ